MNAPNAHPLTDHSSAAPCSAHLHAHYEGDAAHTHTSVGRSPHALAVALVLTLLFAVVEVVAGIHAHSLALISDAGHMVTDAAALALALLAQLIARRPPSSRYSFGFGRAEALAAFVNALAMLVLVGWIVYEALHRFLSPRPVHGATVFIVAAIGLLLNIGMAWLLSRDASSLNTRAALVNVMGDLLGSVAALAAGAIIYFTGYTRIDPILSVLVAMLIFKSTAGVLRESYHSLMEAVPHAIDYAQVGADLAALPGVLSVHDLHVWDMSPGQPALIGHLRIANLRAWPGILQQIQTMLLERHGIDHVTLQPEPQEPGEPQSQPM